MSEPVIYYFYCSVVTFSAINCSLLLLFSLFKRRVLAYHYFWYLYYGIKEVIKAPVGEKVDFFNLMRGIHQLSHQQQLLTK